eukprot:g69148.t1
MITTGYSGLDFESRHTSKKAYFKQKSLVEKASRNAKKDLGRDLESKGVEVVTIQSGRHISVLAAESDVAVDVPSKVPFTPTRHSSSFLSSFSTPSPRSGDALQPHLACISPKPFDISTHPALKVVDH